MEHMYEGVVLWGTRNIYRVLPMEIYNNKNRTTNSAIECKLKGKRGKQNGTHEPNQYTYLMAGDVVQYVHTDEGKGMIVSRMQRKNCIMRRKHDMIHPIAVNVDLIVCMLSVDMPSFRPRFADRVMCIALCNHIPILLVLNKIDLCATNTLGQPVIDNAIQERMELYKSCSDGQADVLYMSVANNIEITTLQETIRGKQVAFIGQSGVGKSSIINILFPHESQKTAAVSSKYNRGCHTTTRPEMLLHSDLSVIDTPGIRELHLADIASVDVIQGFPDLLRFADACRLTKCTHRQEPGCAVIPRIGSDIHKDRYLSYTRIRDTIEQQERNKWIYQKR